MHREEAHKILDKVLDSGYCGKLLISCFKGTAGVVQLVEQTVKSTDEIVLVAV